MGENSCVLFLEASRYNEGVEGLSSGWPDEMLRKKKE
jgi:hypothetical protein